MSSSLNDKSSDLRLEDARPLDALSEENKALQVIAEHIGDEPVTPEEERKLVRYIDWMLLPLIGVCTDYKSIMAQRFCLGLIESGVSPALIMIIQRWYSSSYFYSMAGAFPFITYYICYGLYHINPEHAWKNTYWFFGAFTILWAPVLYCFLADSPVEAKWLSPRQRYVAVERLRGNHAGITRKAMNWTQALSCFTDVKMWLIWIMVFAIAMPLGIAGVFIPLVIKTVVGIKTNYQSLLFTNAANTVTCYLAMKFRNLRGAVYLTCTGVCLLAAVLLWTLPLDNKPGLLAGVYLFYFFAGAYGQGLGFTASNVAGASKRFLCKRENMRRDALPPAAQATQDFSDLTDTENMAFRYQL
ncbi:hypothetical protein RQP46_006263 [Phenoliferia psychrophenolica]